MKQLGFIFQIKDSFPSFSPPSLQLFAIQFHKQLMNINCIIYSLTLILMIQIAQPIPAAVEQSLGFLIITKTYSLKTTTNRLSGSDGRETVDTS